MMTETRVSVRMMRTMMTEQEQISETSETTMPASQRAVVLASNAIDSLRAFYTSALQQSFEAQGRSDQLVKTMGEQLRSSNERSKNKLKNKLKERKEREEYALKILLETRELLQTRHEDDALKKLWQAIEYLSEEPNPNGELRDGEECQ